MVIGIVLAVLGGVLTAWSYNQMDTWDYSLSKAFLDGDGTETIDLAYYAGIALLIIGVLVFIVACIKYFISKSNEK